MTGNNHKAALHDFIRCVFSAILFLFCMVDCIPGCGDLYAAFVFSLVLGTGLVLETIKNEVSNDA